MNRCSVWNRSVFVLNLSQKPFKSYDLLSRVMHEERKEMVAGNMQLQMPSLLYTTTLLYLPSLHYNSLCAAYLYYLLSLPMLLSALLTHSCIPCLIYT